MLSHMADQLRWSGGYVVRMLSDRCLQQHLYLQWALCGVFVMCIAAVVAETASAAPTAGGYYYWTYKYASPKTKNLLSWIVGCRYLLILRSLAYADRVCLDMSTMAYATGTTACAWACAVSIAAGASIGSDFTYVPTTGQTL